MKKPAATATAIPSPGGAAILPHRRANPAGNGPFWPGRWLPERQDGAIPVGAGDDRLTRQPAANGDAESRSPAPSELAAVQRHQLESPFVVGLGNRVFFVAIFILLWGGWRIRESEVYTPKEGFGYGLGITGGLLLLFLLLYPLRKRLRWMQRWGHMKLWFGSHMVIGVMAPTAILFHSNFRLGAVNSNVALFSMLLVVASGLVGRYIYQKINYKVKGHQMTLEDLRHRLDAFRQDIGRDENMTAEVAKILQDFETACLEPEPSMLRRLHRFFGLGFRSRAVVKEASRLLRSDLWRRHEASGLNGVWARAQYLVEDRLMRDYVGVVRVVAEFQVYLRLFALWHVVHIPLMFMLVVTAIVHVVAVHMY